MKKIILTITLLFSHVSFGLDALDGKSIICLYNADYGLEAIVYGYRFIDHGVVGERIVERNDQVVFAPFYGLGTTATSETNTNLVNSITADYISFWRD